MATNAPGPTLAGGLRPIVENGFELVDLPDVNDSGTGLPRRARGRRGDLQRQGVVGVEWPLVQ